MVSNFKLLNLFFALSAFIVAPSFAQDDDIDLIKSKLISRKFMENGDGVAAIRKQPKLLFSILINQISSVKSYENCKSVDDAQAKDLRRLNEYANELPTGMGLVVLDEIFELHKGIEKVDPESCIFLSNLIQDAIFENAKLLSASLSDVQSNEVSRVKLLRAKQNEYRAELKRIEDEAAVRNKISDDNKKAFGTAKELSESMLCDALGSTIHTRARSFTLKLFGDATNVKEVVFAEVKRRKIKLNIGLVEKKEIPLGVSYCHVFASLGIPSDINTSKGSWGIHEQYVYRGYASSIYVYFKNGIVSSLQY